MRCLPGHSLVLRLHLLQQLNYRTVEETDERVVMEMDNRPDLVNIRGALQGGLLATLIDIAGGVLAGRNVRADPIHSFHSSDRRPFGMKRIGVGARQPEDVAPGLG